MEAFAMLENFIDISYITADGKQIYLILVFERNTVKDMLEHEEITAVVNYCKLHDVPVMSDNPQVRAILHAYGVEAQPFAYRAVGE
jgi:hypothetical protein